MGLNSGKNALIKRGTTTVANMSSFNLTVANQTIDAIVFGTGWVNCIDSVQGWSASISGFIDTDDATQLGLQTAALAHTKITDLKLYINATKYYSSDTVTDTGAGAYIESFNITADNNNIVSFDMSIKGNGPLKFT